MPKSKAVPSSATPRKVQSPRQYLAQAAAWTAGINLVLNLLAGWLIYRKVPFMPLEGERSLRADATGMIFIILFFSLLLSVPGIKKQIHSGMLLPYERGLRLPGALRWLLGSGLLLGLVTALAGVFTLVPLVVWILSAFQVTGMELWPFLIFKSLLGALAAASFVPLGEWLAILIASGKK